MVVPDDIKKATLESMLPEELQHHVAMNRARLKDYESTRAEIVVFLEARIGLKMKEPKIQTSDTRPNDPMDVGSTMQNQYGGGGKHGNGRK